MSRRVFGRGSARSGGHVWPTGWSAAEGQRNLHNKSYVSKRSLHDLLLGRRCGLDLSVLKRCRRSAKPSQQVIRLQEISSWSLARKEVWIRPQCAGPWFVQLLIMVLVVVIAVNLYSAISTLEQTHCPLVACDSIYEWLLLFMAHFEFQPMWCTYSTVWFLHGWCHMKLLGVFCVHHVTMHQVTSLHAKPHFCIMWLCCCFSLFCVSLCFGVVVFKSNGTVTAV